MVVRGGQTCVSKNDFIDYLIWETSVITVIIFLLVVSYGCRD